MLNISPNNFENNKVNSFELKNNLKDFGNTDGIFKYC